MLKHELLVELLTVYFLLCVSAGSAGAVRLQVGAFDRAKNLQRRVKLMDQLEVEVSRENSPEGYTRVRTTDLEPEAARKLRDRLKNRGINSFYVDYIPAPSPASVNREEATDTRPQLPLTVSEVKQKIKRVRGTPYRWGHETPAEGFDCSGLIKWLFPHPRLPRTVRGMDNRAEKISRSELRIGNLIFFKFKSDTRPDHVGVYLGSDRFAHASKHHGVVTAQLDKQYYQTRLDSFGRIPVELVKREY